MKWNKKTQVLIFLIVFEAMWAGWGGFVLYRYHHFQNAQSIRGEVIDVVKGAGRRPNYYVDIATVIGDDRMVKEFVFQPNTVQVGRIHTPVSKLKPGDNIEMLLLPKETGEQEHEIAVASDVRKIGWKMFLIVFVISLCSLWVWGIATGRAQIKEKKG